MRLTAENVEAVFTDCLFKEDEDKSSPVLVEGVVSNFGFHHDRLAGHAEDVREMLAELPDAFQADKGGGMTFLNACETRTGDQWGEHRNIEQLLALGIALGQARILVPRELWQAFPGGMPYFVAGLRPKA